ncbi:dihydroorotate dehydrogenase, partial [bacterium]|nr:dihydroorotate dehydrogenase [bacterium]
MVDLQVDIGKIKLINPITLASGTAGYGEELSDLYDLSKLGAIWTKGVSLKPIEGNPMPRTVETASGML